MRLRGLTRFAVAFGVSVWGVMTMFLTRSVGRGQCPECGYRGELHQCKHCDWAACLECWQRLSNYNTCPECGRANP
jgi:hypothetical protein